MNTPLLDVHRLHVAFGSTPILHGVDFQIAKGECFALVGESGSGKSVTAQTLLQLLPRTGRMTQGEIWFNGMALHEFTSQEMKQVRGKQIGMIFQDPMTSLNPTLCVGWQIAETLMHNSGYAYQAAKGRVLELLELVGIAEPAVRYHAYPFQLSGGMRQRVMIAIALACSPLLLIADEPTTALDVTVQAQILDLLQKIRRETGMSVLLITHDLGVVAGMCDRAAVMQHGRIVEMADVDQLFYAPQHPYTQLLMERKPRSVWHA